MQIKKHSRQHAVLFCLVFLMVAGAVFRFSGVSAAPGSVIINELMYNPGTGNQDDEFIELYNTTSSPIDLEGWCFSEGVVLVTSAPDPACFEAGTTIAGNGFLVVSPNPSQTQSTYGVNTAASYAGANLSNGGETITLVDNAATPINSATYDDTVPWPTSPDGSGPSLELKDPGSDNSQATAWGASIGGATPAAENSYLSLSLPEISNISEPNNVTANQSVTVQATVQNATTVNLTYRINFSSQQTATMYDDGAHDDGASGDGIYATNIPGQAAGQLVRFRIEASNNDGDSSSPSSDDSMNYHGYVVEDPSNLTQLPLLQWFMSDEDYNDMDQNHREDEQTFPTVVVYGDQFFDNATVRIYGDTSKDPSIAKVSLNFELPSGYRLTIPDKITRALNEFNLESDIGDYTHALQPVAWQVAREFGVVPIQTTKVRLDRNGNFHGLFTLVEKYNGEWRDAHNYSTGALYKEWSDKRTREEEDNSDIVSWRTELDKPRSAARRQYVFDNQDIPNALNFMAFQSIVRNHDWHMLSNTYQYRDTEGTGRWSLLPWDVDLSYTFQGSNLISPYDRPDYIPAWARWPTNAVYVEPDMRQAYFRRLRTMADGLYANDRYLQLFREQYDEIADDIDLENAKWWPGRNKQADKATVEAEIAKHKQRILVRYRLGWAVPPAQSATEVVDIDTVEAGNLPEEGYVLLKNNASVAVDISSWLLEELSFTFPEGAVLPAGGTAVVPRNDLIYRTAHPGEYNLGQLSQDISTTIEHLTLKRDDNTVADTWDSPEL